jgi:murein DD-endopeptidase MepM/ murein hydrolase activator NlpD
MCAAALGSGVQANAANGDAADAGPSAALPAGGGPEFKRKMSSWQYSAAKPTIVREKETVRTTGERHRPVISSPFGWRSDPIRGIKRRHAGVDLPGPRGARIYATAPGIVTRAGWGSGYGNLVEIRHAGGVRTRYAHLAHLFVRPGEQVAQGHLIAGMGSTGRSTGTHLHYEVRLDGVPVDPMKFIGQTQSSFAYETAWTAERVVAPRWAGWETSTTPDRLPSATIR